MWPTEYGGEQIQNNVWRPIVYWNLIHLRPSFEGAWEVTDSSEGVFFFLQPTGLVAQEGVRPLRGKMSHRAEWVWPNQHYIFSFYSFREKIRMLLINIQNPGDELRNEAPVSSLSILAKSEGWWNDYLRGFTNTVKDHGRIICAFHIIC